MNEIWAPETFRARAATEGPTRLPSRAAGSVRDLELVQSDPLLLLGPRIRQRERTRTAMGPTGNSIEQLPDQAEGIDRIVVLAGRDVAVGVVAVSGFVD